MKTKQLGIFKSEGFKCPVFEDADGRVHFVADADIVADGANGQFGAKAAYMLGDKGSEFLANGGLTKQGKIAESWAKNIFILDKDGQPKIFPKGVLASKTWYKHPHKKADDPAAYLDAETEHFIVVPPLIVSLTRGIVRGSVCRVTWKGKTAFGVVGDLGPRSKIGELSIAFARTLGMDSSPRTGGVSAAEVTYEIWPGVAAKNYTLQPS